MQRSPRPIRTLAKIVGVIALGLSGYGCSFGPLVLEKSHGRYNEAIRRVDEEQLLRNIVRMRYNESPLELKVSSIAAQYELDGGAEARPFFAAPNPAGNTFRAFSRILPDVSVSGANRPTITLIPGDSGEAVERFLTPITTDTLVFLFQTSWPVSTVTRLWVERLNGVPNAAAASGPPRRTVPDFARFRRIADLMQEARDQKLATTQSVEQKVQVGGPLPAGSITASALVEAAKEGLEYNQSADGTSWSLARRERKLVIEVNPAAVTHPILVELETLLNVHPGLQTYELVVAPGIVPDPQLFPGEPRYDLQVNTRSTSQVLYFLANGVEVPLEHLESGVAVEATGPDGAPFDSRAVTDGVFTVHACDGHKPPKNAYVAIKHRGYWYYVDDRDDASKSTLGLVLQVSRLDFGRQQPSAPFLTLPIGR